MPVKFTCPPRTLQLSARCRRFSYGARAPTAETPGGDFRAQRPCGWVIGVHNGDHHHHQHNQFFSSSQYP
ncbi:hypothetical protein P8452_24414 [Trifolium repens]|nr:hypothetical protein P8452_24414 [Trifolium repens]